MGVQRFLEAQPSFDIQKSATQENYRKLGVEFIGTPRRHPYDSERMVLVPSPFETDRIFFEFRLNDILHAEEIKSIVTDEGRSVQLVRFWIRRGSRALTISHFEVGTSFSPGPSRSPE
ncbi:MAG: hypothetical protein ABR590_10985 [Spirochaetia bacterium]